MSQSLLTKLAARVRSWHLVLLLVAGFFLFRWLVYSVDLPTSLLSLYPWLILIFVPRYGRSVLYPAVTILGLFTLSQLLRPDTFDKQAINALISVTVTYLMVGAISEMVIRSLARLQEYNHKLQHAIANAEEAVVAKGRFLAVMSHEIRTPLSGIIGMSDWLLEDSLSERQQQQATLIRQSAESLMNIVNSVLDFSRIEAGKLELHPESFELRGLVSQVFNSFSVLAQNKGLSLDLEVVANCPTNFFSDRHRLRQILANLISNAIKFTPSGRVSLRVQVTSIRGDEFLSFVVEDTGIGMSPQQQQKLFTPFEQLSDPQFMTQGTGLGLVICKEILQQMNTELQLDSQLGRGSRFEFLLPVIHQDAPLVTRVPESFVSSLNLQFVNEQRQALNVLVAEDNPVNMLYISRLLRKCGAEVVGVENGALALAEARSGQYDLLVLDVQMPELSGLEVAQRLKAEHHTCPPLVALTACVTESDRQRVFAAGFDQFVPKPVNQAQIQALLLHYFATVDPVGG